MANKGRALTIDLINHQLAGKDRERGFTMRVHYNSYMFARQYSIVIFDQGDPPFTKTINFRKLADAVNVARKMDSVCEKSRYYGIREATTR